MFYCTVNNSAIGSYDIGISIFHDILILPPDRFKQNDLYHQQYSDGLQTNGSFVFKIPDLHMFKYVIDIPSELFDYLSVMLLYFTRTY